ncbi:MAG: glycosyltransferase family 4 protein [Patescibacteria group bacterium]
MKLLIAAEIFSPDIGGPATYSQELAQALVEIGWRVNLICYSDKKQEDNFKFKVFRITRTGLKGWHHLKYFFKLFVLAFDCDLIYAQGPVSSGLPAVMIGKIFRKKVVVKVVGDYAWEQARNLKKTELGIDDFQNQKFNGKIGRLQKIERQVCRKSSTVVVPSKYLKQIVEGWKIRTEKIKVVYNSFDLPKSLNKKQSDRNLIISAGRLVPWKGFDTLISLMPDLLEENPNFELKICGLGPDKEKLEKLISDLNLRGKVTINSLSHQPILEEMSGAGIFVLNSGYEGLSHTVLESMALGVITAISAVGGNTELVNNGINGYLFKYNDREGIKAVILNYYNHPEINKRLIANAKEYIKDFTPEKMMADTIKTLQSV